MTDFCKVENDFVLTHKGYSPSKAVYGFIGKKIPLKSHKYLPHLDENAEENRSKICKIFGSQYTDISVLNQVHSNKVIDIIDLPELGSEYEADAQITKRNNVLLSIQTADCVPVLFVDQESEVVGAAHAGWRGALSGIIFKTLKKMESLGSKISCIEAVVGPCIHQASYEVGQEFLDQFLSQSIENRKFFVPGVTQDKYMFDLPGYVKDQLSRVDIKNIYDMSLNTFEMESDFFSHRRKPREGSIMSVVGLR